MSGQFKEIFEPTVIGTVEVKNRIVMCPMGLGNASEVGAVTEQMIEYYSERARGGVGLIIVEGTCVEGSHGKIGKAPRTRIDDDQFIAGFNDLVKTVHHHGTKISLQLQHGGAWGNPEKGKQPVSASDSFSTYNVNARSLTIDEIEELVEIFGEAARRAQMAGFDAININGGAGFLVTQFLSPLTNKRTDLYGGDLEGRMTFLTRIIESVQMKVGNDYPIIFDHPVDEFIEGGITVKESKVMAQKLESMGIAAFRMHSGSRDPRFRFMIAPPAAVPQGYQVPYAEETKRALHRAKVMVGRQIQDPEYANHVIRDGKADFIVLGRPLLADPELPKKWAEGRLNDIRRCLYCNWCKWNELKGLRVECAVNAALGKEKAYRIVTASHPRKVLIVGGGPAGLEAARVAAERGHDVVIYEKSQKMGGQLNIASIAPFKEELKRLVQYLFNQVKNAGVRIELGKEATRELIKRKNPDVIILATGARPYIPDIPGIESQKVCTAWDILKGKTAAGEKVIVIGGGNVGLETAEYLAEKGKRVTVLETLSEVGVDVEPTNRKVLLERLKDHGVDILTKVNVIEITDHGIVLMIGHDKKTLNADTVILALGATSNKQLEDLMHGESWEMYSIGDCTAPRNILEAIHDGAWVARQI